ncbi:MAG: HD domain-containing phosphohydrolase [Planctomycetota bacterium]
MNRRVLFVDDDPLVLDSIVHLLKSEAVGGGPYDVSTASSAEEAFRLCYECGPFAAVVTDQHLGGACGVELLVGIRECWPDTTRVLMSGNAKLDLALRAVHEGQVLRLVQKPFEVAELSEMLESALEHFDRATSRRMETEQLLFSRDSLLSLTDELERRLDSEISNLESMQALAARLSSTSSLGEVADVAVKTISRALGGRAALIELENPYRGALASAASSKSFQPGPESHLEPVRTPEGEIGSVAVDVDESGGGPLTDRDRRVLASLISSTALAAHVQIRRFERDEAQHATVFAMARLAERRDNETGQHLDRVSGYCRLIALGMREDGAYGDEITDGFIEDLVRSAPLHDIGKVGIPDNILLKPGKLDADEWEVMKTHTTIGGETMRSIIESTAQPGFLRMGHDIALFHHEKWNGTGYPHGLSGDAIPLCARIVALADVYDALTTRRPYKDPWPHQQAIDLIRRERGEHFDPAVVDAFDKRGELADEIRLQHPDEPEGGAAAA